MSKAAGTPTGSPSQLGSNLSLDRVGSAGLAFLIGLVVAWFSQVAS